MNSMDSIDDKHRKPRRFKGTPAHKIRNKLVLFAVVYTLVSGGIFLLTPFGRRVIENPILSTARRQELEDDSEEERNRNQSMLLTYYKLQENKKLQEQADRSVPKD